jgi:hypothetical protein
MSLRPPEAPLFGRLSPGDLARFKGLTVLGGLDASELAELKDLVGREAHLLTEDDIHSLEHHARCALYRDDEAHLPQMCGAGLCWCDGPCENERDDLTDEQREWLYTIRDVALNVMYRRRDPEWELFAHTPNARVRAVARPSLRATGVARSDYVQRPVGRARPREHRPRRSRSRARSPARSTDDDPEPARRALARLDVFTEAAE